jgi:hypothetical protein
MNGKPQVHMDELAAKLAALPALTREQLLACWTELMAAPLPSSISPSLLRRAVGYAIQEQLLGGLSKQQARTLRRIGTGVGSEARAPRSSGGEDFGERHVAKADGVPGADRPVRRKTRQPRTGIILSPGTRLVREWQGRSHAVDIRTDGFGWNGKHYRSLSAVATAITGARWSGNRFFRV